MLEFEKSKNAAEWKELEEDCKTINAIVRAFYLLLALVCVAAAIGQATLTDFSASEKITSVITWLILALILVVVAYKRKYVPNPLLKPGLTHKEKVEIWKEM